MFTLSGPGTQQEAKKAFDNDDPEKLIIPNEHEQVVEGTCFIL